ncbi:hypothetical protein BB561_004463 [Smittium simulii]|uniref:Uncharacterized protein n=1 Tax=Smittium simulii TaxID=133385 RepID=A0A2T9YGA0_9FUNG|nr:hypothetical protein BB561_004463 [Smittium simulii]
MNKLFILASLVSAVFGQEIEQSIAPTAVAAPAAILKPTVTRTTILGATIVGDLNDYVLEFM